MSRTATLDAIAHDEATRHPGNMDRDGAHAPLAPSPAPIMPPDLPADRLPVLRMNMETDQ